VTGRALRRRRKALGLTQAALADKIGVHRITIAKWEANTIAIPKPIALLIELLAKDKKQAGESSQNRG
jgi:transcriptional regulator with XRE-family HTH domain